MSASAERGTGEPGLGAPGSRPLPTLPEKLGRRLRDDERKLDRGRLSKAPAPPAPLDATTLTMVCVALLLVSEEPAITTLAAAVFLLVLVVSEFELEFKLTSVLNCWR